MNKKILIVLFITVIIIIGIIITMVSKREEIGENDEMKFNKDEVFNFQDLPEQNINKNQILGKWIGISEEIITKKNEDLKNYSIIFYENGTYNSFVYGNEETGRYRLDVDKVIFYNNSEELNNQSRTNFAYARFDKEDLILTFPLYPKTVIYEKEI